MRPYRLHVFVPAIMSAGLLFSIITLLRDAFRRRDRYSVERHARLAGHATAAEVLGTTGAKGSEVGLRARPFYLLVAAAAWAVAIYVLPGAVLNYLVPGSYVSHSAWLLVVSILCAAALGFVGGVAAVAYVRWPMPPGWVRPFLRSSPLGALPPVTGYRSPRGPGFGLTALTLGVAVAFGLITLAVGSARDSLEQLDRNIAADLATWDLPAFVQEEAADLGRTPVVLAVAILVGLATLRCRTFAAGWLLAVLAGLALNTASKMVVERPRPSGAGADSFPSGHLVQVTLLAVLLPLALRVLTRRQLPGRLAGAVFGVAVVPIAISRVQDGGHWPSDVVAGVLLGALLGLGTRWIVAHEHWHTACTSCPWKEPVTRMTGGALAPIPRERQRGVLRIQPATGRRLRRVAQVWLVTVVGLFAVLAWGVGLPTDPDGDTLASSVAGPVQVGLLVLAGVAAALSLRWAAAGAATLAVTALGLGLFASLQYPPGVAYAVTAAFAVPAVLMWLAWQHVRTPGAIFLLAAATAFSLTAEGIAVTRVYEHYFGPATPVSSTIQPPVDQVEWVWSGALKSDGVRVVAKLADDDATTARLVVQSSAGRRYFSTVVDADENDLVRIKIDGLAPETVYSYTIEVDGRLDRTRGRGAFTTASRGPFSFTVAAASCARSGSNAAVYDAIRAEHPLLYLITGDMHYGNLGVDSLDAFLNAYNKALTSPAQAALYRSVPVDYVWDDHDYGPNDADAESPSRAAARSAYRAAVPHPPLPAGEGGAIYHAFTVGRVRFVVTDTRSERTADSMLGDAQERWLLAELAAADEYGLIIWVNPDPWIAASSAGADNWGGFPEQRRRIADAIAQSNIDNLIMVSGDAHMVAIDDGTNSDYSTSGGGGFPVLHAAALDRPGAMKGGPYSEGAYPGAGQFGLLRISDDGEQITVDLEGRNYTGTTLVRYRFEP